MPVRAAASSCAHSHLFPHDHRPAALACQGRVVLSGVLILCWGKTLSHEAGFKANAGLSTNLGEMAGSRDCLLRLAAEEVGSCPSPLHLAYSGPTKLMTNGPTPCTCRIVSPL